MELPEPLGHIELTWARVGCSQHLEPFRARWPKGFAPFAADLFDEALGDLQDEAGEEPGSQAAATAIEGLLDRRPLCERVSRATLVRLYVAHGAGREITCQVCHRTALGGRYTTRNADGTLRRWRLCFDCALSAERVN